MSAPIANSYDQVPYQKKSYSQSHTDSLATVAALYGMQPAPPDSCRVLELGCASGANLIPMAFYLPQSQFLGVDYSQVQIDEGSQLVQTLQLENIKLQQMNIMEIDDSIGEFDYIICHGVYSWVPDEIQDRILSICSENLAASGVAYISYNTYPGWYFWRAVRDLICFHGKRFADPQTRLREVRSMLKAQSQAATSQGSRYGKLLQEKLEYLLQTPDSYLFHEHMEENNSPLYFHEFIERVAGRDLQYLAEVPFGQGAAFHLPEGWEEVPRDTTEELIALEQYLDFLRNRQFRQTLLCHAHIPLARRVDADCIPRFWLATAARRADPKHELRSDALEQFRTPAGGIFTTDIPLVKAAFEYLSQMWPRAVPFDQLRLFALSLLAPLSQSDLDQLDHEQTKLCAALFNAACNDIVELRIREPSGGDQLAQRPQTHALARNQATSGSALNTRFSQVVELSDFNRRIVLMLDGAHDRDSLVSHLVGQASNGSLTVAIDEVPVSDAAQVRTLMEREVDFSLRHLANFGLLTGEPTGPGN